MPGRFLQNPGSRLLFGCEIFMVCESGLIGERGYAAPASLMAYRRAALIVCHVVSMLHAKHRRVTMQTQREGYWQMGLIRSPAWLWPQERVAAPGAVVRLARVVHWSCVGVAIASASFGLAVTSATIVSVATYKAPQVMTVPAPPVQNSVDPYAEFLPAPSPPDGFVLNPPPSPAIEWSPLFVGLTAAAAAALAGRGIRYVLAGE